MRLFYALYYKYYHNRKRINRYITILLLILIGYLFITSLASDAAELDTDLLFKSLYIYFGYHLIVKLFHELIGQYWLLKYQRYLTKEFIKKEFPKHSKCAGDRRRYKDTLQSGIRTLWVDICNEEIKENIKEMTVHLYRFDLKSLDKFIKENEEIFNVASKKEKQENFMKAATSNHLWLKKKYEDEYQVILDDFKANKSKLKIVKSKMIITDYINHHHIIQLLYNYAYYRWRLNIQVWILTNQPAFQTYNPKTLKYKMAKIYSPDFKATKSKVIKIKDPNNPKTSNEYISINTYLAEDYILESETEADTWWDNITSDAKKVILEKGIRASEVAEGHIKGEHVMSLRNGQKAGRTAKIQRDLEESFYSVSRATKTYGGKMRILFIKLFMILIAPITSFHPEIKSKAQQLIERLKMSGWISLEITFSRSENLNYNAPGISLAKILDNNNSLYMSNYQTTLTFRFRDCWGKYNTHYLEYLADKLTKGSKAKLLNLPEWDPDLKLKKDHIIQMNYETGEVFGITPDEIANYKYEKIEKKNENKPKLSED